MSMVLRKFKRSILRLLAVVVVAVNLMFIYHVTSGNLSLETRVKYDVQSRYSNFLLRTLDVSSPVFVRQLNRLLKEKLETDDENIFWQFNNNSVPLDTVIPTFETGKAPTVLPYDPRLTIAVYLDRITKHPNEKLKFHWSDWTDMSKLHPYIFPEDSKNIECKKMFDIARDEELIKDSKLLPVDDYCINDPDSAMGFRIVHFPGRQTVENNEILSKAHLFSGFPSPYQIIFLSNQASYTVEVDNWQENSLNNSILYNGYLESLSKTEKSVNVGEKFLSLVKSRQPSTIATPTETLELTIDMFEFDGKSKLKELNAKPSLSLNERKYQNALNYSLATTNPHKFFSETKLLESFHKKWLGDHYDWRFFNGLDIGSDQQILSLHNLIQNYLKFVQTHGIITWIAHGSLLSWYWNGLIFPWDTDLDVQMPVSELHKLGELYNQTLVVENTYNHRGEFSGLGKYFIDVGSSLTHRKKGNGLNNIDARFIDVDSGLYVDITGLAVTDSFPSDRYKVDRDDFNELSTKNKTSFNRNLGVFQCRNNHFLQLDELSPLKKAVVENVPAVIPSQFLDILNHEYKLMGLTRKDFKDHVYLNNLKLWVHRDVIRNGLPTNHNEAFEQILINRLELDDYLSLFESNDKLFRDFLATDAFTTYHLTEMRQLLGKSLSLKDRLILSNYDFKKIRPDLFAAQMVQTGWNYDDQLNKLQMLTQLHTKPSD